MTSDSAEEKLRAKEDKRKTQKERLRSLVYRIVNPIKHTLFPENITCDICGEELISDTRYPLCAECTSKLPTTGEHICVNCGVPISGEADYCIRCENVRDEYLLNRSPLVYDGEAKELIYSLKFGGKRYLAKTLGAMMSDEFLKRGMSADIAIFVPMTDKEEKKRGFNQSELLARNVAERLNMPLLPALVKVKETSAQKELKGKERAENLKGAFTCVFEQVKGRKILLIDDVFTTGATANACAHALIKAGAREVSVLTAAVTKKKLPVESADGTSEM